MIRPGFFSTPLIFLILLLMAASLAGCGKKGPVRPLSQPVPSAAEEFVLQQQGNQMLLSWTMPKHKDDGSPLTDLAGFRIYRGLYDAVDECPTCVETSELWRVVDLEYLRDVQRVGDRFFLNDPDLTIGQGYQYRIIPFNRWGQDGLPALSRQALGETPPAPVGVSAESRSGRLVVTWQPVTALPAGLEMVGYKVYRRRPGGAFPPAPRNLQPLSGFSFEDRDFEGGKTYLYAVRTVVRQGDRIIESALSELAAVTSRF
jgi:hypothetical protein